MVSWLLLSHADRTLISYENYSVGIEPIQILARKVKALDRLILD